MEDRQTDVSGAYLHLISQTPCYVEIHNTQSGELVYTIQGVVSSLPRSDDGLIGLAIREYRYPDGRVEKGSGVSFYPPERFRLVGSPPQ